MVLFVILFHTIPLFGRYSSEQIFKVSDQCPWNRSLILP